MDDLRAELAVLRARVDALESQRGTIHAPFRVLGAEGQTLLSIEVEENSDWGRRLRLKLLPAGEHQAMLLEVAAEGTASLQIGETVELSGHGFLRLCNQPAASSMVLSATEQDCLLTMTCSANPEGPQIQIGASECSSHLLITKLDGVDGVRRGAGILLAVDEHHAASVRIGQGGPGSEIELRADEKTGGRMVLQNQRGEEVFHVP